MSSFANLKRNSGILDKLAKAIEQLNSAEIVLIYYRYETDPSTRTIR